MTEDAPQSPPRNIGLYVGLGCLGALVLSCCLLTFWVQSYGLRFVLRQGDGTKIWISRVALVGALEGTRKSCTNGVIDEDDLPWFHPNMPSNARNLACSLDEEMLQALASREQDISIPLDQSSRAELASEFGMDSQLCFEHTTDDLSAVGCFNIEGGSNAVPYQIIALSLTRR